MRLRDQTALPLTATGAAMNDDSIDSAELARLNIERVQTEAFLWSGYRYGNARDAIAAAKRGEKK